MTDNFANELADQSALQLWQSYCDKKMECERLHEVNQELVKALNKILWTRAPNKNPSRYAHTVEEIAFRALAKHDKLKEQA